MQKITKKTIEVIICSLEDNETLRVFLLETGIEKSLAKKHLIHLKELSESIFLNSNLTEKGKHYVYRLIENFLGSVELPEITEKNKKIPITKYEDLNYINSIRWKIEIMTSGQHLEDLVDLISKKKPIDKEIIKKDLLSYRDFFTKIPSTEIEWGKINEDNKMILMEKAMEIILAINPFGS